MNPLKVEGVCSGKHGYVIAVIMTDSISQVRSSMHARAVVVLLPSTRVASTLSSA